MSPGQNGCNDHSSLKRFTRNPVKSFNSAHSVCVSVYKSAGSRHRRRSHTNFLPGESAFVSNCLCAKKTYIKIWRALFVNTRDRSIEITKTARKTTIHMHAHTKTPDTNRIVTVRFCPELWTPNTKIMMLGGKCAYERRTGVGINNADLARAGARLPGPECAERVHAPQLLALREQCATSISATFTDYNAHSSWYGSAGDRARVHSQRTRPTRRRRRVRTASQRWWVSNEDAICSHSHRIQSILVTTIRLMCEPIPVVPSARASWQRTHVVDFIPFVRFVRFPVLVMCSGLTLF